MMFLQDFFFSSRWWPGLALLAILLWIVPAVGGGLADSKGDLEEIQQRIRKIADGLKNKKVEEKSLKRVMASLELEMDRLRDREKAGKESLSRLREETEKKQELIAEIRENSRRRREMVKNRLSAMYREGQTPLLRLLFSGNPPSFIAEEYYLLKRVVHHDRELLTQFRRDQAELQTRLAELSSLQEKARAELADLEKGREALDYALKTKTKILARLQSQQAEMNDELARLKEKAARLQSLVKKLESQKAPEYTEKAGVFARHGTVIFAKPFKGYGNLIIVDHGDKYYTLYAQASRLLKAVGEKVKAGEVIAYSGFEDADSVYFEIRHQGTPLDPLAWLKPPS
jgi:septal ring factor EnvC (AmiA/AmiB activator)